jgi:hypothetical protein
VAALQWEGQAFPKSALQQLDVQMANRNMHSNPKLSTKANFRCAVELNVKKNPIKHLKTTQE